MRTSHTSSIVRVYVSCGLAGSDDVDALFWLNLSKLICSL